jgi:two-component system, chemotaxis family, sensor kinase CheA
MRIAGSAILMDQLIKDFLQESQDNLDRLDHDFVSLESDPQNSDLIGSIFRTIHTVKGTCGFLGFPKLEALSHAGENLLSQLRSGDLKLNSAIADALLEMVDAIREYLSEIGASGTEGEREFGELIESLKSLQAPPPDAACKPAASQTAGANPGEITGSTQPKSVAKAAPPAEAREKSKSRKPEIAAGRLGGALARKGKVRPEEILRALQMQEEGDGRKLGEILVSLGLITQGDIEEALTSQQRRANAESGVRVDVAVLENQMNLVSELVLLRNRLLQISSQAGDHELEIAVHALNLVTADLRKNVMKARMQPISQLYEKLPRVVRDISKDLAKKIELETAGGQTELDKSLLEAIKDPVTHILRNSMDHGIEAPARRMELGKRESGTIRVRAFHGGGNFHLEIVDDGAGINTERVKQKAVANGLVTMAQANAMSEEELQALIFAPGLSTAEKVTSVSGRGVGMDVVKTNIEHLGGRVRLQSKRSAGTTIALEIPLTLATISALTVVSSGSVFAVPQAALVELLGYEASEAKQAVEQIEGVRVLRFRGAVLPLLSLQEEMGLATSREADRRFMRIVVVAAEGRRFAVEVDQIRHTEEIVIKPISKYFKHIELFAGAAVLGDGRVALILDLAVLAKRRGMTLLQDKKDDGAAEGRRSKRTLVLVACSHGERMAIPIQCVERLENLDRSAREMLGGLDVMQYGGQILTVASLEALFDERRNVERGSRVIASDPDKFAAVVVRLEPRGTLILQVGQILGIVNVETQRLNPPSRLGVEGSMVIQERVTEIIDVEALAHMIPGPSLDVTREIEPAHTVPSHGG